MASMIGKVNDLECGQAFIFDNVQCRIEDFPTRTSVVLRNVNVQDGQWSSAKTSVRVFKQTAERVTG